MADLNTLPAVTSTHATDPQCFTSLDSEKSITPFENLLQRIPAPPSAALTKSTFSFAGYAITQDNTADKLREEIKELRAKLYILNPEIGTDETNTVESKNEVEEQEASFPSFQVVTSTLKPIQQLSIWAAGIKEQIKNNTKKACNSINPLDANSFRTLQGEYASCWAQASQLQEALFNEIDYFTKMITVKEGCDKPLSKEIYANIEEKGLDHLAIAEQATTYEKVQAERSDFLHSLKSEWMVLVKNLNDSYEELAWYEALLRKPANLSIQTYYGEYRFGQHRVPANETEIAPPNLQSIEMNLPIVEQLRPLKEKIATLQTNANSLVHDIRASNAGSNVSSIQTAYYHLFVNCKEVIAEIRQLGGPAYARVKTLNNNLIESDCAPLKQEAAKTLEIYAQQGAVNIETIATAQQLHQKDRNSWITERERIRNDWDTILTDAGTVKGDLNQVAYFLNRELKMQLVPLGPIFEIVVEEPVPSLADKVNSSLTHCSALLKSIHADIEFSRNIGLPGVPQVQEKYDILFNKYQEIVTQQTPVVQELTATVSTAKATIIKKTLPPLAKQMQLDAYLSKVGKLQGQAAKYEALAEKYEDKFALVERERLEAEELLISSEKQLAKITEATDQINERLCRLAEAYHTGIIPTKRGKSLNSSVSWVWGGAAPVTFLKAPTPEELKAPKKE